MLFSGLEPKDNFEHNDLHWVKIEPVKVLWNKKGPLQVNAYRTEMWRGYKQTVYANFDDETEVKKL